MVEGVPVPLHLNPTIGLSWTECGVLWVDLSSLPLDPQGCDGEIKDTYSCLPRLVLVTWAMTGFTGVDWNEIM